jgi:hypothetical protein
VRPPTFRNVLEERFVDNRRGWSSDPRANAWVADGVYHVVARQPGRFVAVRAPLAASLRDGAVTATFRKTGGPAGGGYGLIVRDAGAGAGDGRDQSGRYYVLEASDRGEVGVWRRDGDRWVDLKPWTASPTVRRNAEPNMLSVRAIGQRLVFLVNGAEAAAIEDAALGAGSVGLFVGGDLNEVQVERFVVEEME